MLVLTNIYIIEAMSCHARLSSIIIGFVLAVETSLLKEILVHLRFHEVIYSMRVHLDKRNSFLENLF